MNDLHATYLVLHAVSAVDGGCVHCVRVCVDEALRAHPDLPWEEAAQLIRSKSDREMMVEALKSSRSMLADSRPAKRCPYSWAVERTYA
jgi:hypothetical protein